METTVAFFEDLGKEWKRCVQILFFLLGLTPIRMLSGTRKRKLDLDCSKQRRSVLFHIVGSPG